MKRISAFFYLLLMVCVLALLQPAQANAAERTLEFEDVLFFEAGKTLSNSETRDYTTAFMKSKTRYVYYEFRAKNLLYQVRKQEAKIDAEYYRPDGSLLGQPVLQMTIPLDWKHADLTHGWGWNVPGNWSVGTYEVDFYLEDKFVTRARFTIVDDTLLK